MKYADSTTVCLNKGEEFSFPLKSGGSKRIRLRSCEEFRDTVVNAVRRAELALDVDGQELEIKCGPYVMPLEIDGLRVQCDFTKGWKEGAFFPVKMDKEVQLTLWDASDPVVKTELFGFPLPDYHLFGMGTQSHPEVVHMGYTDGAPGKGDKVHYHMAGEDFAGFIGLQEVRSCIDGTIVETPPGLSATPRPDRLFIDDGDGFCWFYSHLDSVDESMKAGTKVRKGDPVGRLGMKGTSGRFPHLHVGLLVPEGQGGGATWRIAYERRLQPWLFEASRKETGRSLYAVARIQQHIREGQEALLDGSNSACFDGHVASYRWALSGGGVSNSPSVRKAYSKKGVYSEELWVVDSKGRNDVDFCRVKVYDRERPANLPTVVASCFPSMPAPGQKMLLSAWAQTKDAFEELDIDWGDGGAMEKCKPFSALEHVYEREGLYVITARCRIDGMDLVEKLKARVGGLAAER